MNPAGDAVLQVIRIGYDLHFAQLLQRAQSLHRGLQFHAIVRGLGLRSIHLARMIAVTEDTRPAARPGVSDARAIGDQLDLLQAAAPASSRSKNASTRCRIAPASVAW